MSSSTDHDGPTGAPLQLPYFVMDAGIVPMLVPPQPWVSVTEGGYLLTPGELWRELWGVRRGAHLKRFSLPRHLSCSVLVYAAHTCMHALVSPALHCPPPPTYLCFIPHAHHVCCAHSPHSPLSGGHLPTPAADGEGREPCASVRCSRLRL